MNLQFYFEKLRASEIFKKFMKENPSAFFCSGFFSQDFNGQDNKQHFDFCVGEKIFSFEVENNCIKKENQNLGGELQRVSEEVNFDFNEIENLIREKMRQENIKNKLQKILLSLQNFNGKDFLIATVFISGLGILKFDIDILKKEITKFEKKSFFDMMKIFRKK